MKSGNTANKAPDPMQTILGAGGTIGIEMARVLPEYTDRIRLVSRNPAKVNAADEIVPADLLDAASVTRAVAGSQIVYLLAGLPYKASVWEAQWPVIMRNTIEACREHGSKLVFFDNVYMYDRDRLSAMDESTPVRPTSRKGKVRAAIADTLMEAVGRGDIEALIARSADFYGPGRQANSVLTQTVFERLSANKSGQWLLSADYVHSFTWTPDAARGTAILGNSEDAWGEVWHLPTAPNPPTGKQWIEAVAAQLGATPKVQVASSLLLNLMGLFVPPLRELKEMAYQYDRDYDFRSDKFDANFDFSPTPYADGIKAIVEADYR